ncbi:MAG: dihydrolipoyl dehydrogenase [Spirochaetaceae bacterium]|jgi:dihydrolipoamide dehydrogenase|nr:dihydrolipoyl dehydrogenase [Spirochaetaceae bacterium]
MYDVIVIGSGPGGYTAAIRAAQLGGKTALVEKDEVGGACLNRGCIPTKALIESVEAWESLKTLPSFGVTVPPGASIDAAKIYERKDRIVKRLTTGVAGLVKSNKIDLLRGTGTLTGKTTVEISDSGGAKNTIEAEKIIIASGAVSALPPIPGAKEPGVITSNEALALKAVPKSIAIIGGGVIGVELATVFSGLGAKVTILEMLDEILPLIDGEIITALKRILKARGIDIFVSAGVKLIETVGSGKKVHYETGGAKGAVEAELVIIATGRKAYTDGLGLEAAGVKTDRGRVLADERQRTSAAGIYAIGDVSSNIQLAHVAMAEGVVAAENALGHSAVMDYSAVPSCIYTNPEIAGVGITEKAARDRGLDVSVGKFPLAANGRAMTMGETAGFVKIIADKKGGRLLGASLLGPHATELIAELTLALRLKATVDDLKAVIHPHPTLSEAIFEAAHDALGECIHLPARK